MQALQTALAPLAAYNQFIMWKLDNGIKTPISPITGFNCNAHDPSVWMDAQTAVSTATLFGCNVGFTFTNNDPFYFIDIDHCIVNSEYTPLAIEMMNRFAGAAIEISQSGEGVHIIGVGKCGEHRCKSKVTKGLELYTNGRFIALTGSNIVGDAGFDCGHHLQHVVDTYFKHDELDINNTTWTDKPVENWHGIEDDDELIKKACKSRSAATAFGGKASFNDLWMRNVDVLAANYPAYDVKQPFDASSADAALAQHLAFWTGKHHERIKRLMLMSGLNREKWHRKTNFNYLHETIYQAVNKQNDVYGHRKTTQAVAPLAVTNTPLVVDSFQFLGITEQLEHFNGCVYIQDIHRIFTPSGAMLKSEQFNATYGGYVFQLEADAGGKTTRKAFEAFTESQAIRYSKAESTCFRPELERAAIIEQDGRSLVNTYIPIDTLKLSGDPTPFLNHLIKLLPDERDRLIILSYMAACIQYKGRKFTWAPLLQGMEGNGKSLLSECVAFAIGDRYVHFPPAAEISEKFNSWLFNTLFIGVEDIYVPDQKREIIEVIKPMITQSRLARRAMNTDQVMCDCRANFIFNSNHRDAIRKTMNDRRFAVFFTNQQVLADMVRDKMTGNYFPNLYDWLNYQGFAIVNNYLSNFAIPDEFNPAGSCHRAPTTSSTDAAIEAGLGSIEQELLEAIDEERVGFAGGWVSSMAFDKLLKDSGSYRRIPHNKRREILQSLGYDWHPALMHTNGRVNTIVPCDNGKPRLFIKKGHIHANLCTPPEVAKHYQEAQNIAIAQLNARFLSDEVAKHYQEAQNIAIAQSNARFLSDER